MNDEKPLLHPRNLHRQRYSFPELIAAVPELGRYVRDNTINFADPVAVKLLNKALLQQIYQIQQWDIPAGYLCPPIPGRVDYLHYLADLLGEGEHRVLDIGTGANCIYPLLGQRVYGWQFVASDIDIKALNNARNILAANPDLKVTLRLQKHHNHIFNGIILPNEQYSATMCNPPFHASMQAAQQGTQRKWKNLGKHPKQPTTLNFGGQGAELWCTGGELAFIKQMIHESKFFTQQCRWFTTLVSKASNLAPIQQSLRHAHANEVKIIEMAQGQKQSRVVAWRWGR